jgi:hypothetical protein
MTEISLPFGGLFGQNVAEILFLVLYLSAAGKGIAF